MKREEFSLVSFNLKDKQEVTASYKYNGKIVKEEFTEAVHPNLYAALMAFTEVAVKQTGLDPEKKTSMVAVVETRSVHIWSGADERSIMITVIIE